MAATTLKNAQLRSLDGILTGGGTLATGGFTLTVPATDTAALLGVANVFTADQTINSSVTNYSLFKLAVAAPKTF